MEVPAGRITIKDGKIEGIVPPDGTYILYGPPIRGHISSWKTLVRKIADHVGESNVAEFEKVCKLAVFSDPEISITTLNKTELQAAINRLEAWSGQSFCLYF